MSDIRDEWRIRDVENKANEATRRLHEISTLRSNVDGLEREVREIRTLVDGIRFELQDAIYRICDLEQRNEQLNIELVTSRKAEQAKG